MLDKTSILEKLAEACTDYEVYIDGYHDRPVGSNDLNNMKQDVINTIGDMLQEILDFCPADFLEE